LGWGRPCKTTGYRETKQCSQAGNADELAHGTLLKNGRRNVDRDWARQIDLRGGREDCSLEMMCAG
jgi:hypothetical protein